MLVGNVAWETLHLPLYTLWRTSDPPYLAFVVIHCSVGDLMIATATLFLSIAAVGRGWPRRTYGRVAAVTILSGLAYTVFSEWLNVSVRGSWTYAAAMPVVPVLGTGLSPLLQWIVVPCLAFWRAARGRAMESRPPGATRRRSFSARVLAGMRARPPRSGGAP